MDIGDFRSEIFSTIEQGEIFIKNCIHEDGEYDNVDNLMSWLKERFRANSTYYYCIFCDNTDYSMPELHGFGYPDKDKMWQAHPEYGSLSIRTFNNLNDSCWDD